MALADEKITQLPDGGDLLAGDVLVSVRGGSNVKNTVTSQNLRTPVIITVGASNSDFTTIGAALASITDNALAKPYTIQVAPGSYTEDNSGGAISFKPYVRIEGQGSATITPNTPANPLFTAVQNSFLNQIAVSGCDDIAISKTDAGNFVMQNVTFINCDQGFVLNNSAASVTATGITFITISAFTMTTGVEILAGNLSIMSSAVASDSSIVTVYKISGVNSIFTLRAFSSFSLNVTNAIYIDDSARTVVVGASLVGMTTGVTLDTSCNFRIYGSVVFNAQANGFWIKSTGASAFLGIFSTSVEDSTTNDILVECSACQVIGNGNSLNSANTSIVAGAGINFQFIDLFPGDEGMGVLGELHVGSPGRPSESVFGQGDSYVNGMKVYTFDGSSYVDVSSAASSVTGSTFSFPNINVNTAVYVASSLDNGSDVLKHSGIKALIDTAAVIGSGEIVLEYWDGVSWEEVNFMVTEGGSPYNQQAKNIFLETSEQIRYSISLALDNWTKNDDPSFGTNLFWIRYRIKTAITTSPILQQFKLHPSRYEINNDGWVEYFGTARPVGTLPWVVGASPALAGNLQSQKIWIDEKLGSGFQENVFTVAGDLTGLFAPLPLDLDTSSPINLKLICRPNGTGITEFTVRWGWVTEGDTLYTSDPGAVLANAQSQVVSKSLTTGELSIFDFSLDVSDALPKRDAGNPDFLCMSIEMTVRNYNVAVTILDPNYLKWCEGLHIG